MDDKIKKQLRSDYEELEIQPSADLWNQIDTALGNDIESNQKVPSPFGWWKYAAIVLLLISVGTLFYYNGDYDGDITDRIVKKNIKKAIVETENNLNIIPQSQNPIYKTEQEVVKKIDQSVNENGFQNLKPIKKVDQNRFSQPTATNIVLHQPEENFDKQEYTEIINQPIISESKKINYISANDLLLGRELDKSREKSNVDTKKFGVIHIDKVIPKVGNVTVLGVTVYIDPN